MAAARMFTENPSYRKYRDLLTRIHDLNRLGLLESSEADALRDEMEQPWYDLSPVEQERLKGLSADLYALSDEEVSVRLTSSDAEVLLEELRGKLQRGDWEGTLRLLRKVHHLLPKEQVACIRGQSWGELGEWQVAYWFFEQARTLDPKNETYGLLARNALSRVGQ